MTVYVDDRRIKKKLGSKQMHACHMWADSTEELLDAARKLDLNVTWLQTNRGNGKKFFYVSQNTRSRALKSTLGVREIITPKRAAQTAEKERSYV